MTMVSGMTSQKLKQTKNVNDDAKIEILSYCTATGNAKEMIARVT